MQSEQTDSQPIQTTHFDARKIDELAIRIRAEAVSGFKWELYR